MADDGEPVLPSLVRGLDSLTYHPVSCEACDCEIAVMDYQEVFHFFNVIN